MSLSNEGSLSFLSPSLTTCEDRVTIQVEYVVGASYNYFTFTISAISFTILIGRSSIPRRIRAAVYGAAICRSDPQVMVQAIFQRVRILGTRCAAWRSVPLTKLLLTAAALDAHLLAHGTYPIDGSIGMLFILLLTAATLDAHLLAHGTYPIDGSIGMLFILLLTAAALDAHLLAHGTHPIDSSIDMLFILQLIAAALDAHLLAHGTHPIDGSIGMLFILLLTAAALDAQLLAHGTHPIDSNIGMLFIHRVSAHNRVLMLMGTGRQANVMAARTVLGFSCMKLH
jgi:hypothetical protein